GGRGHRAIYRGAGSVAIIGVARTAFLIGAHPDDDGLHVLACTKCNLAETPPALAFRITANDQGQALIRWEGQVDITADDVVLALGRIPSRALEQAKEFLNELLGPGPRPAREALDLARAAGISQRTLERAKLDLQIESRHGEGPDAERWFWN